MNSPSMPNLIGPLGIAGLWALKIKPTSRVAFQPSSVEGLIHWRAEGHERRTRNKVLSSFTRAWKFKPSFYPLSNDESRRRLFAVLREFLNYNANTRSIEGLLQLDTGHEILAQSDCFGVGFQPWYLSSIMGHHEPKKQSMKVGSNHRSACSPPLIQ